MAKRRNFTPEFKAEVVLEVLSGRLPKQKCVGVIISTKINSHSGSDSCLKMRHPCLSLLRRSRVMPRSVSPTLSSLLGD